MTLNPRPYVLLCAATTNATVVRPSRARLCSIHVSNLNDAPIYVKFYNKATTPDENDTPVKVVMCPSNLTVANGAGTNITGLNSIFETGLSFRVVKSFANNGTTAVDASEVIVNLEVD